MRKQDSGIDRARKREVTSFGVRFSLLSYVYGPIPFFMCVCVCVLTSYSMFICFVPYNQAPHFKKLA